MPCTAPNGSALLLCAAGAVVVAASLAGAAEWLPGLLSGLKCSAIQEFCSTSPGGGRSFGSTASSCTHPTQNGLTHKLEAAAPLASPADTVQPRPRLLDVHIRVLLFSLGRSAIFHMASHGWRAWHAFSTANMGECMKKRTPFRGVVWRPQARGHAWGIAAPPPPGTPPSH